MRQVAEILKTKKRKHVDPSTISRELHRQAVRPFKRLKRTLLTEKNIQHRVDFTNSLKDFSEEDCLNLAPSDKFFLYSFRKPNNQNDRVWATSRDQVWDALFAPQVKHPTCVGFYICFTKQKLIWDIKAEGQSWDGQYFREQILKKKRSRF